MCTCTCSGSLANVRPSRRHVHVRSGLGSPRSGLRTPVTGHSSRHTASLSLVSLFLYPTGAGAVSALSGCNSRGNSGHATRVTHARRPTLSPSLSFPHCPRRGEPCPRTGAARPSSSAASPSSEPTSYGRATWLRTAIKGHPRHTHYADIICNPRRVLAGLELPARIQIWWNACPKSPQRDDQSSPKLWSNTDIRTQSVRALHVRVL